MEAKIAAQVQSAMAGVLGPLVASLRTQGDEQFSALDARLKKLQPVDEQGAHHSISNVGFVLREAMIPPGFFTTNLHQYMVEKKALQRIQNGEAEDVVVQDILMDYMGTGAQFGDALGKFLNNKNCVRTAGGGASAATTAASDQISVLSQMIGEHSFGVGGGKKLTTAELSRGNFPGGSAAQQRYQDFCATPDRFRLFLSAFATHMEEVGRQIKPGGAGTSSSMFQAQASTVGLTCQFEQQRSRCQRLHDDYADFIHSFGTHIMSIMHVDAPDDATKLFADKSGSWHPQQALNKAKLFFKEIFCIRTSLAKQPYLALFAVCSYAQRLKEKNWVDEHLDRLTLGAPVRHPGMDRLAAAMSTGKDPFAEVSTMAKAVAEANKKQSAMEKLVSSLQSDLAKKTADKKTADEKMRQVLDHLNTLDQKVKKAGKGGGDRGGDRGGERGDKKGGGKGKKDAAAEEKTEE